MSNYCNCFMFEYVYCGLRKILYFLLFYYFIIENFKTLAKGHEPGRYVAPMFCWSFLNIYLVNLKGPK